MYYKIKVNRWEFIVNGNNEDDCILKTKNHISSLITVDGYTIISLAALEEIERDNISIEEYNGFVIN